MVLKKHPPFYTLGALIITNVITSLKLDPEDQDFVTSELKWLFNAADNFLQVYQSVQSRLAEEKSRLIRQFAGDVLCDRKVEEGKEKITPQVWREEIERCRPVAQPIPSGAQQLAQANNKLLSDLKSFDLGLWGDRIESFSVRLNRHLKNLSSLQEQAALQGATGKGNVALQNQIEADRMEIITILLDLAQLMDQAYGIKITSPDRLIEFLQ